MAAPKRNLSHTPQSVAGPVSLRLAGSAVFAAPALYLLALGLWAIAIGPASARPNVYTVANVNVDVIAANAVEAKKQAQSQGEVVALRRLLKRLTKYTDYQRLPEIDLRLADGLLDTIAVLKEGNSRTRYKAKLTYRFRQAAVKRLLQRHGVAFMDHQAPRLQLIAAVVDGGKSESLDNEGGETAPTEAPAAPAQLNLQPATTRPTGQNSLRQDSFGKDSLARNWRKALNTLDLENALTPIKIAAEKNAAPQNAQPKNNGWAAQKQKPAATSARGSTDRIVTARLAKAPEGDKLLVTIDGRDAVGAFVTRQSFPIYDGDVDTALAKAAAVSLKILEGRWKTSRLGFGDDGTARSNARAAHSQDRFTVTARFSGLREWIAIRRHLQSVSGVYDMQPGAVSPRGASIALTYPGGAPQLAAELARAGFDLQNVAGQWVLQRR